MDCEVGVLVDLSESPENCENVTPTMPEDRTSSASDNKPANTSDISVADSIELLRSEDCSKQDCQPFPFSTKRVLQDVTNTTPSSMKLKTRSPAVKLLDEEIFDFDIALSPLVRTSVSIDKAEDSFGDEEVFFGPMGFTEQLVSVAVGNKDPLEDEIKPLSPLNPEQIAELVKEAHGVACRIFNDKSKSDSQSSEEEKSKKFLSFSKTSSSSSDDQNSSVEVSTDRSRVRTKTFVLTSDPVKSLQEMKRKSLPSADIVPPTITCVDININSDNDSQTAGSGSEQNLSKNSSVENLSTRKDKDNALKRKELPRPSKIGLSRSSFQRNSNLYKAVSCDNVNSVEIDEFRPRQRSDNSDVSDNTSMTSDLSVTSDITDVSSSKLASARRTLQQPKIKAPMSKISKLQAPKSTLTKAKLDSLKVVQPLEKTSKFLNRSVNTTTPQINHHRTTSGASASSSCSQTSVSSKSSIPTGLPTSRSIKKPGTQLPNKSATTGLQVPKKIPTAKSPGVKKSNMIPVHRSSSKEPPKKSQLMKPGELQKKALATNKSSLSKVPQPGPLKAYGSSNKQTSSGLKSGVDMKMKLEQLKDIPNHVTPVKPQKTVHPKRLLSDSACTPTKTSHKMSASTPSSDKKRNSCLPTPNRLRLGSVDSLQSASAKSGEACDDSPVFSSMIDFQPNKSRRALVQHTPNLPPKKVSIWSPIKKQRPVSKEDEAIQCTKKLLNRN